MRRAEDLGWRAIWLAGGFLWIAGNAAEAGDVRDPAGPCGADFAALCPQVPPGKGRVVACLRGRESELSPACRALLACAPAESSSDLPGSAERISRWGANPQRSCALPGS